ncbi:MAG: hypothetical protein VKJ06_00630 [Vampirovibrionales bacterium]|nr:hypothetical protein [Vampirovibrionales bacterium]
MTQTATFKVLPDMFESGEVEKYRGSSLKFFQEFQKCYHQHHCD